MADTKLDFATKFAIGYSNATINDTYRVVGAIVRVSDRLVSPEGAMVEPVPVINTTKPGTVAQRGRNWEIEIEVDSDAPAVFKNTQQVTSGTAASRALRDGDDNGRIDYFMVNFKDTAGATVSHLYETQRVYLTYAKGRVSNEKGVERHPALYRFICVGSRTTGNTDITGVEANDEQYTGITSVTVDGSPSTNILWYEWEFIGQDGGDILTPRYTPNTYESVGVTEWPGKYWRIRLGIDSTTTIFDDFINQGDQTLANAAETTGNTKLPTFIVVLSTASGGTTTHTYEANKVFVSNFDPGSEVSELGLHNTAVVELVCIGTRSDS